MPGEFEPNDSRNVTGTATTPDGRWTGQSDKTPDAAGNTSGASGQQQQQGGMSGQQGGDPSGSGEQSANAEAEYAPGGTGGSSGEQSGSFSGSQPGQPGSGGQQNQFDSSSGQMGGSGSGGDLASQVREHMSVVGPDGQTCGKVDSVEGGQIKLTKHDSADGQHHYLDAGQIASVEGDQVRLSQAPDWTSGGESGGFR